MILARARFVRSEYHGRDEDVADGNQMGPGSTVMPQAASSFSSSVAWSSDCFPRKAQKNHGGVEGIVCSTPGHRLAPRGEVDGRCRSFTLGHFSRLSQKRLTDYSLVSASDSLLVKWNFRTTSTSPTVGPREYFGALFLFTLKLN